MPWIHLIGPLVMAVGIALMLRGSRRQFEERTRVDGRVLRWDHKKVYGRMPGAELRSLPVVAFTTPDGREIEAMPPYAADRGIYRTGQGVEVFYDPADPEDVRIRLGWLDRPWAMLVVAGGALTFLTLVVPLAFRILA